MPTCPVGAPFHRIPIPEDHCEPKQFAVNTAHQFIRPLHNNLHNNYCRETQWNLYRHPSGAHLTRKCGIIPSLGAYNSENYAFCLQ